MVCRVSSTRIISSSQWRMNLSLWEVPGWKQVYTMPIGSIRPAVSPARDHVLVAAPMKTALPSLNRAPGT